MNARVWRAGRFEIDLERPRVMAIVNVTPDSFSDGDPAPAQAIARCERLLGEGADILDIGGESTRPGADPLPAAEELRRVLPVLERLGREAGVPISIDTYKAEVARAAIDRGATIVNDVSGLLYEPALAGVIAETGAAVVLMHTRGRSKTMLAEATYDDVAADVARELRGRVHTAVEAGIHLDRIILDPGVGFAKRPSHSYGVLAHLSELASALERPLLVGPSRKSFMRDAVGRRPAGERDWGTAAAVTAAVLGGAHIVRVHAVAEMVQVVRVAEEIRRHGVIADMANG